MIYIVHGNDYAKSRKLVINQSSKVSAEHITERDIEDIAPKELYEALVSFDLFGQPPFVVLKVPATKVAGYEEYEKAILKTPEQAVLIILCATKLGKANDFIKSAKKFKAKIAFNEKVVESNVFNFVDNLFYKNPTPTYRELQKLQDEDADPFYIFSMMLYGLRTIAHAKHESEEFNKKSGFVKDKALRQAENFTEKEINELFNFFYDTEKKLKTGKISTDLVIPYAIQNVLGE